MSATKPPAVSHPTRFYVKRTRDGVTGWTGPIRGERQANREAAAWRAVGRDAEVLPTSPEVRAAVRAWEKGKRA